MSYADAAGPPDHRFAEYRPALTQGSAIAEANRCLYCFDAPCMQACPTHIDVPTFIRKIAHDNRLGSARTILSANILGASCARACPVEVLCEGACVLHHLDMQPIQIGLLQRHAMDGLHGAKLPLPFTPAADAGKRVALIGAGPASLACAAELRRCGIAAIIFDARPLPGGLNTYGIAEYKLPFGVALHEVQLVADLGVEIRGNTVVDVIGMASLLNDFDAVFLGIGLGGIHRLGVPGEQHVDVTDALDLIAGYKQGSITAAPRRVVVVGAGNTAIDAAIAAVRLGAESVTVIYRRGLDQVSAFSFEYEHAVREGVRFEWFVQPVEIIARDRVEGVRLQRLAADGSLVQGDESVFVLAADTVVLAIGQATHTTFLHGIVETQRGRIVLDRATGQTSNPKIFAGGDCTNGGREVVDAVADGKRAGISMAAYLLADAGEAAHADA